MTQAPKRMEPEETKLMVTIPFEEYQQLQGIAQNFKKLVQMNAEQIEHHFRSELNYYKNIVEGARR